MRPVEGFYVKDANGVIFAVKGILQPMDKYIVVPRYMPDEGGDRWDGKRRYSKMPSANYKVSMGDWPKLKYMDPFLGLELLAIGVKDVVQTYDPMLGLAELRRGTESILYRACVWLAERLESGGLVGECMGVSGSILLGLEKASSDMDLVIYGYANGRRAIEALRQLRAKGDTAPLEEEVPNPMQIPMGIHLAHERRKLLKGVLKFEGRRFKYLIRCVLSQDEYVERYGEAKHSDMGDVRVEATVIDDRLGASLPTRYSVSTVGPQNTRVDVVSYGGIISEQARKGERVLISGKREAVVRKNGITESEIVVDTGGHYLYSPELVEGHDVRRG